MHLSQIVRPNQSLRLLMAYTLRGNTTSRTMTFDHPLQYGTDAITMLIVASKSNGTQDYLFGDAGASASAPSIISGYNGLDFDFMVRRLYNVQRY